MIGNVRPTGTSGLQRSRGLRRTERSLNGFGIGAKVTEQVAPPRVVGKAKRRINPAIRFALPLLRARGHADPQRSEQSAPRRSRGHTSANTV